jgi:starch synthase (maltosyl-transferring)
MEREREASRPVVAIADERPDVPRVIDGRRRVVVERLQPEIDGGRFPIKRSVGERVRVTVDLFADGQDLVAGAALYRHRRYRGAEDPNKSPAGADLSASAEATAGPRRSRPAAGEGGQFGPWEEVRLVALGNDSWGAEFTVTELGEYEYTVEAWIDRFATWLKGLIAKAEAGQDVSSELLEGAELVHAAASRLGAEDAGENLRLLEIADKLRGKLPQRARVSAARDPELRALMETRPDRSSATRYERALIVSVDTMLATCGAWYEMFPRSVTPDPSRSGTFREAEARLPAIAAMGFDVLYLPPIHPIGRTHRKGPNNTLEPGPDDPGSPWAIGAEEGGHTAIEPGLGTIDDFDHFVRLANRLGLEVALDIAFQASPDHPWVREHPEWFKHRPDGTIKYAENPPKKYQDIYPIDFESRDWERLWAALRDVFLYWIAHGVKTFRVDNPHTKSFGFWEWCIAGIRREHPDAIFLSEAFTRPKVMRYLAKAGFSQSYTYFTWRNSAHELREYMIELTRTELQEYMRPNFFANTPDILHEYLQTGGRPAFEIRLILAATLAASYGIYSGYELCERVPVRPGSEEYVDSEKYQIRVRDWNVAGSLQELIANVNQIRRDHPALQQNATLAFYGTADSTALLWYSKTSGDDRVFVAASTDPHWVQAGWVQMPIWEMGIAPRDTYIVEDLLDGARYTWRGEWNFVRFEPDERMAHIFVVRS